MSTELVPYSDIEKMGKAVATSGLFGVKTEAQAIALMLIAQAYGQHPAIAAMEYHIISGKPSKKSEAMLASFIQAGGKVQWHKLDDTIAEATFSHPSGGELRLTWDIKMAEKAGLLSKDGTLYKKYPRAMLRSRLIAEGVRTIYPAATGGMLAKEEAEDLVDVTVDSGKSRVEQIIDTTVSEVKEDVKTEKVSEGNDTKQEIKKNDKPKEAKKESKSKDNPGMVEPSLPADHKQIIGVIEGIPKSATMANPFNDNKPGFKTNFVINENKYGTFDEKIVKEIMAVLDIQSKSQPIMVVIEYKERISGDKTLNDIIKFRQALPRDVVPI